MSTYSRPNTLDHWLELERLNSLSKVARTYNASGYLEHENKTRFEIKPGGKCLENHFNVNAIGQVLGNHSSVEEWTQQMEDLSTVVAPSSFTNIQSCLFNGVGQLLDGGDIHSFTEAQAWSIGMWIKPNNIAASMVIVSKIADVTFYGWEIRCDATTGRIFWQMRSLGGIRNYTFANNVALVPGVWQHLTFTYAGGSNMNGCNVYKDAVISSTTPVSGTLSGTFMTGQPFQLGSRNGGFFFSGLQDEITVWNKELNQAEITELYNGGSVYNAEIHSASASLVSFYRFETDVHPIIQDIVGGLNLDMINMSNSNFVGDVP